MRLVESIRHFGQDGFVDVLKGELARQKGLLPLERFCQYGGFPSYDDVSVHVDSFKAVGSGVVEVACSVYFTEVVSSNCAVCSFEQPANGFLLLRISADGNTDMQVL
ncbi:MAG: hypothetical protein SFH39_16725 [Candidatus Magnetobacterium sp. LHC-1]|uniref:Uncharacterized protein n=1 Tax=Candidatus Magnetobacterium casense TaxID=1455061 RepID=A0ABS6RZT8_9BACT|nr:hypothetical protein [Candidatus Magnetobacterium casensis]MBF0609255.1 hypothetical protein [Nitrospirota bacterium]MBV6342125.1 hypothetical protein [Candidatus Magnetobacterium casensis]